MSRIIQSSQYETNLWSTQVNIVRLTEPIRRCVRQRTQVFKIEVSFLLLPLLSFFGSCFIFRAAKTFAPKPNGNACYAGYTERWGSYQLLILFLETEENQQAKWLINFKFQKRYLKQARARGPAQQELMVIRVLWSTKEWILPLHSPLPSPPPGLDGSLPPWTREVVKTSQRAYTARESILIGEVWSNKKGINYNSTPLPPSWMGC